MRAAEMEERRHWHLDKTFNIGHIITTVTIAITLGGYVTTMDKRIAILEAQSTTQAANVLQVQQAQKDVSKEIRDEIRGLRAELMSLFRKDRQ